MSNATHLSGRLLTIQQAAQYTGLAVSTIYTMVSQQRIPYTKVGRCLQFDVGLLEQWIKQHTVMPMLPKP